MKCLPIFIFLKWIMTIWALSSKDRGDSLFQSIVWLRTCEELQISCGLVCAGPISRRSTEMCVPSGDLPSSLQILPRNLKIGVLRVQPSQNHIIMAYQGLLHIGLPANAGDRRVAGFDPCVGKIPWKRACQLIPVLFSRESHGQRSLCYGV